jgi:RNA polymerase sigma-70 factor (ECF subfamily)
MATDPLEALLERLSTGNEQAAAEVFRTCEPYLRVVVRRQMPAQLRSKFDSVDIVQSVWADVLDGFREAGWRFTDAAHLRAFLVKVTRNRLIDRLRRYHTAAEREQRESETQLERTVTADDPRPSEVAQANELWEQMLSLCPPRHRPILQLKRQGCSLDEIAAQTHLHPSSVRRILYDLARRLALRRPSPEPPSRGGGST